MGAECREASGPVSRAPGLWPAAGSPGISEAGACELVPVVGHLLQLPARLHVVYDFSQVRHAGVRGRLGEFGRKMQGSSAPQNEMKTPPPQSHIYACWGRPLGSRTTVAEVMTSRTGLR